MKLRPPFKIHGGKRYLASWIINSFPKEVEDFDYMESHCGAVNVLLNKPKSKRFEVINDLDEGVISILKSLRDAPEPFIKKLKNTTYSERVFNRELNHLEKDDFKNTLDKAFAEFVARRMSRGGLKKSFAWSERERGGKPGDVNAWETIVSMLPDISARVRDAFIFNKPAPGVIKAFNYENMLLYCDPAYVPDTRVSQDVYGIEMTTDDHIALATVLNNFKGKVVLSGYPSTLYKRLYEEWRCIKKKVANHSSQQKAKSIRIECIWLNYDINGNHLLYKRT